MTDETLGGEGRSDGLAPVIPLFGSRGAAATPSAPSGADAPASARPVARLRGGDQASGPEEADVDERWHRTWIDPSVGGAVPETTSPSDDEVFAAAEKLLLKKLRTRALSVREARSAIADLGLEADAVEALLARFLDLGYLDDEALAEQLIDKAMSRKAQGRQAIAQTLSQRGLPRDVIEIALAALPDDESERALEFARSKAASMDGLERDVALRRLSGQLARRGYGSAALSAARQALDERASPKSRVRFE